MKMRIANFVILILILAAGAFTFLNARGDKMLQLFIGILTTVSYVLWGIIYHAVEGDLHPKVMVEYLLVGAIALTILLTVIWT